MIKEPQYGEDVIVLVKFENVYSYYLSYKECWVLDNEKWGAGFEMDTGVTPEREF
jgi:hypothetical protein